MAEEEEASAAESDTEANGKKKLFLIIGGIVLLLLCVGTPLAYMSMQEPERDEHVESDEAHSEQYLVEEGFEDEDELEEDEDPLGAIFPLETFVVNLSEGGYLRCQVQLEFGERNVPRRFYTKMVPIRDSLISLFSKKTKDELGAEKGRKELKKEIIDVINVSLKKKEVNKVYFTQFVVQ